MADDAASFKTEIDSISSGFTKFGSICTLSTKTNGSPPLRDVVPLTLKVELAPGAPPLLIDTLRFGTTPCSPCPILLIGRFSKTSPLTDATAPVKFAFF